MEEEYEYEIREYLHPDEDLRDVLEAKRKPETAEKLEIMRGNVLQVLLKSTVMPFRWLKSSYRCFYCYDVFTDPIDLKSHNEIHTEDEEKYEAMNKYWDPVVFVDVSNISCKLCPENVKDIYQLIDHLILDHEVEFNKDIGICITAFKLNSLSVNCTECDISFRTFGHLLVHTNKEHKSLSSQILCEICGQSFRSNHLLKDHIAKIHENKPFKCPKCDMIIEKPNHLRTHMQHYHDKRYKCLICTEEFETHYRRSHHMMTVHKNRETVTCPHCPRTFVFRSTMKRHVRETHLQEKNVVCPVCGWQAFEANRLARHMMKHSNERNFKCTACNKAFKTLKTMKQHFHNIHEKVSVQELSDILI